MSELVKTKYLKVDRKNPLVRLPAEIFNGIDKRKRKIPIRFDHNVLSSIITIYVDWGLLKQDEAKK
jgi:hypothetical protein